MPDLVSVRRAYAQAIAAAAGIRTPLLVDALAAIPRERFLGPGPWTVIGPADGRLPPRQTPDGDPHAVYDDVSIAIDAERQLFNGAPSFLARLIDALDLAPGSRVLHLGAGLGYYTALMAHIVGPSGRVLAVEVDDLLASDARHRLTDMPWVEVQHGDGAHAAGPFDAVLVNAGVTHVRAAWLDALAPRGRLLLPLTVALPAMGTTLGKGVMVMIARAADGALRADVQSFVAIYSAIGLRDRAMEQRLEQALRRTSFPNLTRVRRDGHEPAESCWLHGDGVCLSMAPV